jgi:AcrR family transcriptional regulator
MSLGEIDDDADPGAGPSLTRSQAARRGRVIAAAMTLASAGGYESVQMRDVAATADVALGTIYRYFSSKDELLAATLVEWSTALEQRLAHRPPRGDTPADQVIDVVARASRAMERNPRLTSALITAVASPDPAVLACQRDVSAIMTNLLGGPLASVDPQLRDEVVRVLAHVWFSALLGWVNGWTTVSGVVDELEIAVRLLLR